MQQQQLFPTVANHMTPMKETVKGTNHFQPPPPKQMIAGRWENNRVEHLFNIAESEHS